MWMLPSSVKIYVASEPTDLRRGFDGLVAATRSVIGQSPLSGHLFVFVNRRRNRVKILSWDRTGYVLLYKRLERGSFERRCCMTPTTSKESASYVFGTKSEISMESVTYQYSCNNAGPVREPAQALAQLLTAGAAFHLVISLSRLPAVVRES